MAIDPKKIKVLFWRTEFYGALTEGGTVSLHLGKIKGLRKLGAKVVYVSAGPMKLPPDVPHYVVPYSKFFRNLPEVLAINYNGKSIKAVAKIIEKEGADFLHQHHHDFHFGGARLKKELGLPFILHADGVQYWVKKNWGKLYFAKLLRLAEETQLEAADAIIVVSEQLKKQLIEYGADGDKIVVAPNGVHPEEFNPEVGDAGLRKKLDLENKFVIGYAGTFGRWHGVDVLARAAKFLTEKIPEAVVLFVGDGDLRPLIEDIAKKDGTLDKIRITGFVPFETIPNYLAACDVLTSPCVNNPDSELFNSPVKLFEYLAMGKPVVASDVGQQGTVVENGVTGLLCEEKNPEDLAEKIRVLYDNKDLAKKLGENARKAALEKYDWKENARKILKAYEKIAQKKSASF